jgi:fumarate reductase flavoprotein subunit
LNEVLPTATWGQNRLVGRTSRVDRVDVVIVGAGTAGLPAAIEAADAGARVELIDKQPEVGGMLHISSGQFSGAGTRRQTLRGIQDSPSEHLADVQRLSHGKANRELVSLSVTHQTEAVDWLDGLGFDFAPDTPRLVPGHELYSVPRTFWGQREGRSLLSLLERELRRRVDAGSIVLRLGARVSRLIADADQVHGVEIGSDALPANAVVLATGGYAANRELVARFLPREFRMARTACLGHATGDGLLMAESLGAATTNYGHYMPTMGQIPDPDRPGFAVNYLEARLLLIAAARTPYEVWVNARGERFVAEDTPSPEERERALLQQPDLLMAIVWDQAILAAAEPIVVPAWTRERIAAEAARGRWIWMAPTLRDLARHLKVDADGLERTLAEYNASVAAGRDVAFGRHALPLPIQQPPFYGLVSQAAMLMSREGLHVDRELRVLRHDGRPIPNLYAVGEVLGASQFMGDSFVGGMSVGPAIAMGRLVGRRLGEQVRLRRAVVA